MKGGQEGLEAGGEGGEGVEAVGVKPTGLGDFGGIEAQGRGGWFVEGPPGQSEVSPRARPLEQLTDGLEGQADFFPHFADDGVGDGLAGVDGAAGEAPAAGGGDGFGALDDEASAVAAEDADGALDDAVIEHGRASQSRAR